MVAKISFFVFGGLPVGDNDVNDPIECFILKRIGEKYSLHRQELEVTGQIDFGSLVHHTCLKIPSEAMDTNSNSEIVLVGGGVQGFAFGPQFASSILLTIRSFNQSSCEDERDIKTTNQTNGRGNSFGSTSSSLPIAALQSSQPYVVYVAKQDAHKLRQSLQKEGYLDKRYRMTPAEASDKIDGHLKYIAVPVTQKAYDLFTEHINSTDGEVFEHIDLIKRMGRRAMPLSTAIFASNMKLSGI